MPVPRLDDAGLAAVAAAIADARVLARYRVKGATVPGSLDSDPDSPDSFIGWLNRALEEHAVRTPQQRAKLAELSIAPAVGEELQHGTPAQAGGRRRHGRRHRHRALGT